MGISIGGGFSISGMSVGVPSSPFIQATTGATTTVSQYTNSAITSFYPFSTVQYGLPPYTYFVSSGTLPTGITIDSSTGLVSGTPTVAYSAADVVFGVKDSANDIAVATSTVNFTIISSTYTVQYLVVAGGGGGGSMTWPGCGGTTFGGGGGGGAGVIQSSITFNVGKVYTATIGAGGTGPGSAGSNSTLSSPAPFSTVSAGGGFQGSCVAGYSGYPAHFAGGSRANAGFGNNFGGGGGSTTAAGNSAVASGGTYQAGNGAIGLQWTYNGSYYGGGGGGGTAQKTPGGFPVVPTSGTGGTGGGGNGGKNYYSNDNIPSGGSSSPTAPSGTVNTGGGGGGGATSANQSTSPGPHVQPGGAGGSGTIAIAVPTPYYTGTYTGSNVVITTPPAAPGMTVIKFNSSGTYTG